MELLEFGAAIALSSSDERVDRFGVPQDDIRRLRPNHPNLHQCGGVEALVVWSDCDVEVVERGRVHRELLEDQESEGRAEDVEEVCHRMNWRAGNWGQQTGDRELGTGNWGQQTGQGTGGRELGQGTWARWKRELGVDEVEVLVTVEKDGGSVNQLVQCGSSKGCGGLPECRWLAAGDGEVA